MEKVQQLHYVEQSTPLPTMTPRTGVTGVTGVIDVIQIQIESNKKGGSEVCV